MITGQIIDKKYFIFAQFLSRYCVDLLMLTNTFISHNQLHVYSFYDIINVVACSKLAWYSVVLLLRSALV